MSFASYFRATETETQRAQCAEHGTVEAVRQIPRFQVPHIITAVRRAFARRKPFRCPTCEAPVTVGRTPQEWV